MAHLGAAPPLQISYELWSGFVVAAAQSHWGRRQTWDRQGGLDGWMWQEIVWIRLDMVGHWLDADGHGWTWSDMAKTQAEIQ